MPFQFKISISERGDIRFDNDYEEKIPYMQTFRFIQVTRY